MILVNNIFSRLLIFIWLLQINYALVNKLTNILDKMLRRFY